MRIPFLTNDCEENERYDFYVVMHKYSAIMQKVAFNSFFHMLR